MSYATSSCQGFKERVAFTWHLSLEQSRAWDLCVFMLRLSANWKQTGKFGLLSGTAPLNLFTGVKQGKRKLYMHFFKLWELLWWDIWYFAVQIAKSLCCIMLIPISKCSLTASFPVLVILLLAVLVYGKNKFKGKMLRSNLIL